MRPNALLPVLLSALAVPVLAGVPEPGVAALAAQALPPAELPEGRLVPMGATPRAPVPFVEEVLDELAGGDAPDEREIAREIEKDSAEIEAVREAEEASHVQEAPEGTPSAGDDRIALLPEIDHGLAHIS
jgi:membrane-bound lytic murein transglycosylase D